MPCWPDILHYIIRMRWVLGETLLAVAILVLLLWAPGVKWRWARLLMRAVGVIIGAFILVVVGFGELLASGNPKPEIRQVASPTGAHNATLTYSAGFLGRDFTSVEITNRGCCEHFTAYEYSGPSEINGTTVVWLDDSHLEITYDVDSQGRFQKCQAGVANVTVICKGRIPPQTGATSER
jgi:hypothetical protein